MSLLFAAAPACDPGSSLLWFPGGRGGGAGGGGEVSIVGSWRRTVVFQTSDDLITSETTWIFGSDARCERTVTQSSARTGLSDTTRRFCSYALGAGTVTIRFDDGGEVSFTVRVSGDRLSLDGVEFVRVA